MKTFNQFRKDIDEAAPLVTALPKIVSVASKVAPKLPKIAKFASGALKFGTSIPVGLGIANVLQSTGDGESNFEKLDKMREKGEGADLEKKEGSKLSKKNRIGAGFKDALANYKNGLSAGKDVESTSSTGRINIIQQELEKRAEQGDPNAIKQLKKFGQRFKENMKRNRNMPNDK